MPAVIDLVERFFSEAAVFAARGAPEKLYALVSLVSLVELALVDVVSLLETKSTSVCKSLVGR